MEVEDYKKLILETLYTGFMKNPPNRIKNEDIDNVFVNIDNATNFRIAREELIQDGLLHGKNTNWGNPPHLEISGEGIFYYEKHYILPSIRREYTLLTSRFLSFLRDIGDKKHDFSKFIGNQDDRVIRVVVPRDIVNKVIKKDYNYIMNDLKWLYLYFTSFFIEKHVMKNQGVGFGNGEISLYNVDSFCLSPEGNNYLKEVFLSEKLQKISNKDGKNRITQLYDDLTMWIPKKRWVDVAINMGTIIEYCIDHYVKVKGLSEFYKKNQLIGNFSIKVGIILQNPNSSTDPIFDSQYRASWKRIQNVLRDWRNYIHISKLVKEQSPLDEQSIQNFYRDFETVLNVLLNL